MSRRASTRVRGSAPLRWFIRRSPRLPPTLEVAYAVDVEARLIVRRTTDNQRLSKDVDRVVYAWHRLPDGGWDPAIASRVPTGGWHRVTTHFWTCEGDVREPCRRRHKSMREAEAHVELDQRLCASGKTGVDLSDRVVVRIIDHFGFDKL